VALLVAVALGPPAWSSGDLLLRVVVVVTAAGLVSYALQQRFGPADPDEHYLDMLSAASAIRVELDNVRIATVHRSVERAMISVTWCGARTTLLDADAHELARAPRNGLTTSYTMTIPVDDDVAAMLSRERTHGEVSVYAVTDLAAHHDGNVREHGVIVEQYDLAFRLWSGSLPTRRIPQPWEH
jgi:hypothetical protein